ncbi:MAG: endonuclease [Bacteroidetes bacterium]|nr:endonuclease [Bacteroidota bacterium]
MSLFKHFYIVIIILIAFQQGIGQIPPGYYDNAAGLNGTMLQEALHDIIDDHTTVTYGELWELFELTDQKPNGKVWDIYSDIPGGTPPYQYTFITDQCGNYTQEGDCYNREHSFPKSWFGGEIYPMYSDLFHIYPTDGWVNGQRGNHPYGEVGNASWTSLNSSKLGNCISPGYSGTVFEPIDEYKGDLARGFFYMATRYYEEDITWPGSDMFNGSQPKPWALELLWDWHMADPVSSKETDRNNTVYDIQGNRNPFIDHPEYVEVIWFYTAIMEKSDNLAWVSVYPNPVTDVLNIRMTDNNDINQIHISLTGITGQAVEAGIIENESRVYINTAFLRKGIYFLKISNTTTGLTKSFKIIK